MIKIKQTPQYINNNHFVCIQFHRFCGLIVDMLLLNALIEAILTDNLCDYCRVFTNPHRHFRLS